MEKKNFAFRWLAIILAFIGLVIAIPASYFLQSQQFRFIFEMEGHSLPDYIISVPGLFFGGAKYPDWAAERNTLVYTVVGFALCGFVLGQVVKLIIAASRSANSPKTGS